MTEVAAANTGTLTPDELHKIAEIEKLARNVKAKDDRRRWPPAARPVPSLTFPFRDGDRMVVSPLSRLSEPHAGSWLAGLWNRISLDKHLHLKRIGTIKWAVSGKPFWGSTGMEVAISSARASGASPAADEPDRTTDG